ncbi:hypothetical protein MES4922_10318 [Mesorhizobium ventifaucium]|uniref:Uncharacterized protein n=1 Tax=Mesorhizobium ventifaucium TaxID=666020 RepID=A0ABN8J8E4_9HYPH|nr:hypothetical protein MES4922_10318 [Mesorhizobium ventifaucium]
MKGRYLDAGVGVERLSHKHQWPLFRRHRSSRIATKLGRRRSQRLTATSDEVGCIKRLLSYQKSSLFHPVCGFALPSAVLRFLRTRFSIAAELTSNSVCVSRSSGFEMIQIEPQFGRCVLAGFVAAARRDLLLRMSSI